MIPQSWGVSEGIATNSSEPPTAAGRAKLTPTAAATHENLQPPKTPTRQSSIPIVVENEKRITGSAAEECEIVCERSFRAESTSGRLQKTRRLTNRARSALPGKRGRAAGLGAAVGHSERGPMARRAVRRAVVRIAPALADQSRKTSKRSESIVARSTAGISRRHRKSPTRSGWFRRASDVHERSLGSLVGSTTASVQQRPSARSKSLRTAI